MNKLWIKRIKTHALVMWVIVLAVNLANLCLCMKDYTWPDWYTYLVIVQLFGSLYAFIYWAVSNE